MRDTVRYPDVENSSGTPWSAGEQVPSVGAMPKPYVILHDGFSGFGKPAPVSVLMPFFPATTEVHRMQDVGHFIHIERPQETARRVLQFFGA